MNVIEVKHIEKNYGTNRVLDEVNLVIEEGSFFTLLGPSGCGKTTLLRIIAGFVDPDRGQVLFEQTDITEVAAERRDVGMVFQNYALFPFMNVFDNVAYGLKVKGEKKQVTAAKVEKYLGLVNLTGYEHRNVSELSGGEQQRVALARALAVEPKVLLLDEPLSNLDARLRDKMRMELKDIQRKLGITCIFVTHDQKEALTMSDQIAVFNQGQCVQVGTPKEIYARPVDSFVASFIGETNLLKAEVTGKQATVNGQFVLELDEAGTGSYVSVRPQDIVISQTPTDGVNCFEGRVRKAFISGDLEEYELMAGNLELKAVGLNTMGLVDGPREGDMVWITIDPKVIRVLDE